MSTVGRFWALLFFLLVFFASLTSTISLSEIPITFLIEERNLTRNQAINWAALFTFVLATLAALSFNVLDDIKLWGKNIFDMMDYAASNIFMLLGGLFTAVYVGWILDRKVVHEQITKNEHVACCPAQQGVQGGTVGVLETVPGDGVQHQIECGDGKGNTFSSNNKDKFT